MLRIFPRLYWHAYARFYARLIDDPQRRVACYRKAGGHLPDVLAVQLELAEALERLGDFDEAHALYRRLHAGPSTEARVLTGLLRMAVRRGRLAEALTLPIEAGNADAEQLLWLGRARQRNGDIAQAIDIYRGIDRSARPWVEAQAELVSCLRLMGDLPAAKALACSLKEAAPDSGWSWFAWGNLRAIEGSLDEAESAMNESLRRAPEIAAAWALKGQIAYGQGQSETAECMFREALRREPGQAESLAQMAQLAIRKRNWPDYFSLQQEYIEARPGNLAARLEVAEMFLRRWRLPEAVGSCDVLLKDFPDEPKALKQAAIVYAKARDYQRANLLADQWLLTDPDNPDARRLKAHVLDAEGLPEAALDVLLPLGDTKSQLLAAQCLGKLHRDAEAISRFKRVLETDPGNADACKGLGNLEQRFGNLEEARKYLERAVILAPGKPEHLSNLGFLYWKQNDLHQAEGFFLEALRLEPDFLAAHFNLCIVQLTQGKFAEGWREYEWRFRHQNHCDYPLAPNPGNPEIRMPSEMLPFDYAGKRILIAREQGLGDELFFLRFAARLKAMGAWVAYQADPKVKSLVERTGLVDRFVDMHEVVDNIHLTLLVGELPLMTGMKEVGDIPPPLHIEPLPAWRAAAAAAVAPFAGAGKPLIGITWRAGPEKVDDGLMRKLVPLAAFARTLKGLDANFVVLQRNPLAGEIETLEEMLERRILDCSAYNADLEQMLGLVALLDDYVTVSNTNLHLRVGLGLPARVLVPCPPEYRWMAAGEYSPWYPRVRVYRQTASGDWSPALGELERDLQQQAVR